MVGSLEEFNEGKARSKFIVGKLAKI